MTLLTIYEVSFDGSGIAARTLQLIQGTSSLSRGIGVVFLKEPYDDTYQSANYQTAKQKIDFRLDIGTGAVTITTE